MKVCTKCHIEKDESEFFKDRKVKDGLCRQCKKCRISTTKYWRNRIGYKRVYDKEEQQKWFKDWYRRNKARVTNNNNKHKELCSSSYAKVLLKQQGFTNEQIEQMPILIDKKRLDVLVLRSKRIIKIQNKNNEQKSNRCNSARHLRTDTKG